MRVLFLDIDGVLNSRHWFVQNRDAMINTHDPFERSVASLDTGAVRLISDFVAAMDLRVVISSTWRRLHSLNELNEMLTLSGWRAELPIGVTPTIRSHFRGDEVMSWLADHPEVTNHVILDDDSDFHEDQHLVRTSMETGVTHEHIDLAIGFLI